MKQLERSLAQAYIEYMDASKPGETRTWNDFFEHENIQIGSRSDFLIALILKQVTEINESSS